MWKVNKSVSARPGPARPGSPRLYCRGEELYIDKAGWRAVTDLPCPCRALPLPSPALPLPSPAFPYPALAEPYPALPCPSLPCPLCDRLQCQLAGKLPHLAPGCTASESSSGPGLALALALCRVLGSSPGPGSSPEHGPWL